MNSSYKKLAGLKTLLPEVDYQALVAQMPNQSHPRRKLAELQRNGDLIRLKKGFYVFTRDFIGKDYSPQISANLLYGPSYLSLEYALSFYGLIPEWVEVFTSVTSQKNKAFSTPVGQFVYRHLHPSLYPLGVTLKQTLDGRNFVMATPEKALMDIFTLRFKNAGRPTATDLRRALEEDLRVDLTALKKLKNRALLEEFRPHYRHRSWNRLLIEYLTESA